MASSVALNIKPAAAATAPAAPVEARPGAARHGAHDDFSRPLHEARQQHTATSGNASATRAAPATSTAAAESSRDDTDDQPKDSDKDKPAQGDASDATTAMLALLGQSVPALAAAAPAAVPAAGEGSAGEAAATKSATIDVLAGALPAPSPGLMPLAAKAPTPATGDAGDDAGVVDGLVDDALSASKGDVDDAATAVAAAVTGTGPKGDAGGHATPATTTQGERSDPLDALRAMSASPLMQAPAAAPTVAPAHALTMNSAVGSPAFAQELGQQVAWLGGQDLKQARIRLHPEDLGQLDVKVSVQHDHVDVSFIAQHPQAVHAVQQTLGQLDAMLAHHGLALGHAEVGQGGRGDSHSQGASPGTAANGDAASTDDGGLASVVAPVVKAVGLLDMFA
ncbi:flagellar hook-length control protein FliK [Dyella soli]|uniref:Flagellar hook-length control protein FliK n=1 Tax=Dyella soli TaxID=522319 RepID=A0A4R0YKH9_9GAMM|nr:flagellar hook-length control protein FliK [Dyella soli]TCI06785.1 flagellar hook-length control protein FliK [Dyella soli]